MKKRSTGDRDTGIDTGSTGAGAAGRRKRKDLAMNDIATRTRQVVAARLGPGAQGAPDGARFVEDLHATSLDQVELIMSIEDAFGIEVPDAASEKIFTVGDLVAFVQTTVAAMRAKAAA